MRPHPALTGLFLLAASATVAAAPDGPRWEPPLPTPPRQSAPCTAPACSLPGPLKVATADLFARGLADPRGCEYRRIRIRVGSVWGGAEEVETSGWVLPAAGPGAGPEFAVAWSGVVYPLLGRGEAADLEADVRSMLATPGGERPRSWAVDEKTQTAIAAVQPIRVCLLLRLGRADLAERLGAHAAAGGGRGPAELSVTDTTLRLAEDLAWSRFDRAVGAHMRGDDALALADLRFLSEFARPIVPRNGRAEPGAPLAFDFLGQLPEFLADQERRARERARPPVDRPAGDDPEERTAALIRDLDQVAVRQWGQPGGVTMGESPIVRELIQQGDAAVDALIRDFRADDRLTRSVSFHRNFHRGRTIHRADEAAFAALSGILRTSSFAAREGQPGARPSRRDMADRIEAYWRDARGVPLVERWYRKLADDAAGPAAWLEAAGLIAEPENVEVLAAGGPFVVTETRALPPGTAPRLRGEPLREGHEPTVSELMLRRARTIASRPAGDDPDLSALRQIASALAAWDAAAAVPVLREATRSSRERFARLGDQQRSRARSLALSIADFTEARIRAGDGEAIPEYAAWVRGVTPRQLDLEAPQVFRLIADHAGDPILAEAADFLFRDPRSPWVPLVGRAKGEPVVPAPMLIESPLLDVPAFRAAVLAGLDDRTPIGRAVYRDGSPEILIDGGMRHGLSVPPHGREPAAEQPVRRCDYLAWLVSRREGGAAFDPFWDEAERDAAVATAAASLRRSGD